MHTLVVRMSLDPSRTELVTRHFHEDVVSWVRQQPGFMNGQWLIDPERDQALGIVVFATEDAATAAAQGPRHYQNDRDRAWNIEDVTVYEQVTSA